MDIPSLYQKISKNNRILQRKNVKRKRANISKNNTVIIIDWDDTLFPTSWMDNKKNNNKKVSSDDFLELDNLLISFLDQVIEYGKVFIVTNAGSRWIKKTSKYVPKTREKLKSISVISARDKYKKKYKIINWKKYVFRQIIRKQRSFMMNILSIGDSKYEQYALLSLLNINHPNRIKYLKSLRMLEDPTYTELINQIEDISQNIEEFVFDKNHIDKTI